MMNSKRFFLRHAFAALFSVILVSGGFAQNSPTGEDLLRKALESFGAGLYQDALVGFRGIILDKNASAYHGDAYFWVSKAYLAMEDYENAERNLELFLSQFKKSPFYEEGVYQKGRLLYLQGLFEESLQVLQGFLEQYPNSTFKGNVLYYIGETLYSLGHLDESKKILGMVVQNYPASYKVEAARYRIALIEFKYRERELLKLLKWSHEETLKGLEEARKREASYEEAIQSYQKKIAAAQAADLQGKVIQLTDDVAEKQASITALQTQATALQAKITALETELATAQKAVAAAESAATASGVSLIENTLALVKLKERALELKSYYLTWLEQNLRSTP